MDNKSRWLLGAIGSIIIVAVLIYFISLLGPKSSIGEDHFSLYPIVIAVVVAPFVIAFLSNSNPEQPVIGMIKACRNFEQSKKFEAIRPYLSKEFLSNPKILLAIQWSPAKIKTTKTEVTDDRYRMIVRVTLEDDMYYVFKITKRAPYVDPKGSTSWVISDIEGI